MTPLVTIGIPTYNREPLVRAAIASALAQDHPALEVVVSDNASTDGTEAFCRALASAEPRLRYVRQDRNVGATANFRGVLQEARGEYFMWLTDDDVLDPNYVSQCVAVLEADRSFDLVAGRATLVAPDGRIEYDAIITLPSESASERVAGYYRQVGRNSLFFGVARTSVLRGRPPMTNILGADWLFIAGVVFGGKARTLETTSLTRSAAGTSDDLRAAGRSLGFGTFARRLPRAALAFAIAKDLLLSPTYAELHLGARLRLALRCSLSSAWRNGVRWHIVRTARRVGFQPRVGSPRSRSEMVSAPTAGQATASEGSSQRTPAEASGT